MTILYLPSMSDDPKQYWLNCAIRHETEDAAREPHNSETWIEAGAWCRQQAYYHGAPKLTKTQRKLYEAGLQREAKLWVARDK